MVWRKKHERIGALRFEKTYPGFTLGPVSLRLPSGCILGLIGENGAGKSTTIRLILDIVQRESGSITLLGQDTQTHLTQLKEEVGVRPLVAAVHHLLQT